MEGERLPKGPPGSARRAPALRNGSTRPGGVLAVCVATWNALVPADGWGHAVEAACAAQQPHVAVASVPAHAHNAIRGVREPSSARAPPRPPLTGTRRRARAADARATRRRWRANSGKREKAESGAGADLTRARRSRPR